MHNVLPCNIHWQAESHEDNILKTVAIFQNSSHFYHYISSHVFHKLSQAKKHSRMVYGFDDISKIFLQYSLLQATDCFYLKKKMQWRDGFMLS